MSSRVGPTKAMRIVYLQYIMYIECYRGEKRYLVCIRKPHQLKNSLIVRDVMASMLVVWNNKIFLLWELTSIFMQTM